MKNRCTTNSSNTDYTIVIMDSTGKDWRTMASCKKVSKLKELLPDGVADLLIWIAGSDFTVDYTNKHLTKKKVFTQTFVKALFTRAFEDRVNPMFSTDIDEGVNSKVVYTDFNILKINVDEMIDDLDALDNDIQDLRDTILSVQRDIKNVEAPMTEMENKINKKLDEAIERIEDRYHTITGRRRLMV